MWHLIFPKEGEEIVITTTSYDIHQTETRSIVKILHGHKILILDDPLSYTHLGKWLFFNQIDM